VNVDKSKLVDLSIHFPSEWNVTLKNNSLNSVEIYDRATSEFLGFVEKVNTTDDIDSVEAQLSLSPEVSEIERVNLPIGESLLYSDSQNDLIAIFLDGSVYYVSGPLASEIEILKTLSR
jgi:hypothetical protein